MTEIKNNDRKERKTVRNIELAEECFKTGAWMFTFKQIIDYFYIDMSRYSESEIENFLACYKKARIDATAYFFNRIKEASCSRGSEGMRATFAMMIFYQTGSWSKAWRELNLMHFEPDPPEISIAAEDLAYYIGPYLEAIQTTIEKGMKRKR